MLALDNNMPLPHILTRTKNVWLLPIITLSLVTITHIFFCYYNKNIFALLTLTSFNTKKFLVIEHSIYSVLIALNTYWFGFRLINRFTDYLKKSFFFHNYLTLSIMVSFFSAVLKALIFLVLFNMIIQQLHLPRNVSFILNKFSSALIISLISWLLFKLIDVAQQLLLHYYKAETTGSLNERKIYTQTLMLKRFAYALLSVITGGAILVLFDNVRAIGASVLTTAGVFGLILTFTAQRSLASIFSGLEIALTQPIKIGDSVVIENELGTIEEINFRNVIVKLADWRRLVVPANFFLEKSFQNWSRVKDSNLIGSIVLYVDFTLPVPEIRRHFEGILKTCNFWDGNVSNVQVSELKESVMQLKVSASARNPEDLSKLRSFLREELISYIVSVHPYALPKNRSYNLENDVYNGFSSLQEKITQEA